MLTPFPKVSIIIATFNRAEFIGATLDSILNQSFENWEIIIVDDGGTDNTKEVLESYLQDERIKFYNRESNFPKGCPGSRNYGLTFAFGEYIWFFDDDDIAHPELLTISSKLLEDKEVDFVRFERTVFYDFSNINFNRDINFKIKEVAKKDLKNLISGKLPFNSCQVIWRKSSLKGESFRGDIIYSDDWEFYSRLLQKGLKGVSIDKVLLFARKHPGSSTQKLKERNTDILNSVSLANFVVIDRAIEEKIMDEELFTFFYRKAIQLKSFPIAEYLLKKKNLSKFERLKYKIGFKMHPILHPFFRMKKLLSK